MAEDLGQEDVVGLVFGLEPVAADGSVGASEVARFPGLVQGNEGVRNVLWELGAAGGVDGIGAQECFHDAEVLQGADDQAWLSQDRDRVGLEAGARGLAGLELATEDEGGEGKLLFWRAEAGAKEDFTRPAAGQGHEGHAFFEVAVAAQKGQGFLDESLRIKGDQVGLVPVNALVIGGVDGPSFFGIEREIGKTLAGAHLSGAQDQMVGVDCVGVAVLGEVKLDGGQGVIVLESADLGLADPAQFLQGQGAGAAVGLKIRPRGARCAPERLGRGHPDCARGRGSHVAWQRGARHLVVGP